MINFIIIGDQFISIHHTDRRLGKCIQINITAYFIGGNMDIVRNELLAILYCEIDR